MVLAVQHTRPEMIVAHFDPTNNQKSVHVSAAQLNSTDDLLNNTIIVCIHEECAEEELDDGVSHTPGEKIEKKRGKIPTFSSIDSLC